MDFLHRNPFVRLLPALIAGILAGNYLPLPAWFPVILFGLSVVLVLVHKLIATRKQAAYRFRWLFGCGTYLFFIGLGLLLIGQAKQRTQVDCLDKGRIFAVEITDRPEEKPRSVLCRVRVNGMADSCGTRPTRGQTIVYLQKDSASLQLRRGDQLLVYANFTAPAYSHNPESFNYAQYLQRQGIAATAYVPQEKWRLTGHNDRFSVMDLAERCRQHLLDIYRKYHIDEDNFGVLAALTLGYKESLSPDIRQSFSATGAMHILAVSGLHTGIIFVVLNWIFSLLLGRFRRTQGLQTVLIILCLWMYAFITGLSPSVLRATIMFSLVRVGMSLQRTSQTYNTIAASAFLMLLCNPFLLFNVGFQLSYSAVVAIILYQQSMTRLIYLPNRPLRWLWSLLCVSVAAQIGTAPWTLHYFHQFSNYFLLTNILAIPMASIIIYSAVFLLVVSPIHVVGKLAAGLLNAEVSFLNAGIRFIEKLPCSTSETWISATQVALLFGCIALATVFAYRKKAAWLMAALGCLLLFFSCGLARQWQNATCRRLIVYADNRSDVIQLTDRRHTAIYTDNQEQAAYLTKSFSLKYRLAEPQWCFFDDENDSARNNCFVFNGLRFLLLCDAQLLYKTGAAPLEVDYLLVGAIGRTRAEDIFRNIRPQNLMALGTCPAWKAAELERACAEQGIGFYSLNRDGAWCMEVPCGLRPQQ